MDDSLTVVGNSNTISLVLRNVCYHCESKVAIQRLVEIMINVCPTLYQCHCTSTSYPRHVFQLLQFISSVPVQIH